MYNDVQAFRGCVGVQPVAQVTQHKQESAAVFGLVFAASNIARALVFHDKSASVSPTHDWWAFKHQWNFEENMVSKETILAIHVYIGVS